MPLRTSRGKSPTPVISYPRGRKLLFHFLLLMSDLGQPVRIKFLPSLAFGVAHRRSTTNKSIKPPGRNWARASPSRTQYGEDGRADSFGKASAVCQTSASGHSYG
jgi:hypothetical protein